MMPDQVGGLHQPEKCSGKGVGVQCNLNPLSKEAEDQGTSGSHQEGGLDQVGES